MDTFGLCGGLEVLKLNDNLLRDLPESLSLLVMISCTGGGCCEDEVVYKVNFEYRVILHTMELKQVFLLLYIHEYILSVPCCSCALFLRT